MFTAANKIRLEIAKSLFTQIYISLQHVYWLPLRALKIKLLSLFFLISNGRLQRALLYKITNDNEHINFIETPF